MIYLDHNAATPPDPRVLEVYRAALSDGWANPSSPHAAGRRARSQVEEAREQVAALCGVAPGQVTFTASGTEALNQALEGAARSGSAGPPRLVASAVEHPAVLAKLRALTAAGRVQAELAPVDSAARLDLVALERILERDGLEGAALVAVLAAQNEVGTLQDLASVGALCAAAGAPLLVDASQAMGRVAWDWARLPWDLLVLSGHKMGAPRGAAALVHRGRAEPRPLLHGGSQERGRRGGTEAVAPIAALGGACALMGRGELVDPAALRARRDRFEAALKAEVGGVEVLAADAERLPQTTALLVPGDAEALLVGLDLAGIHASSGSACSSGALEPSHVLAAMGIPPERSGGRLRFSFGPETSEADLLRAAEVLGRLSARAS